MLYPKLRRMIHLVFFKYETLINGHILTSLSISTPYTTGGKRRNTRLPRRALSRADLR